DCELGPPGMDDKDTQPQPERSERETPSSQTPEAAASGALVEPPEAAVTRLETELGQLKDRYLRLAAEYDNFRKRMQKERTELWQRAQADLIRRFVDAIDDLTRFARVDPAQTDARTMHEGVDMVARKFLKQLEAVGVTRVDQADRKSTRLNSSHVAISYAVFCLKKKKTKEPTLDVA